MRTDADYSVASPPGKRGGGCTGGSPAVYLEAMNAHDKGPASLGQSVTVRVFGGLREHARRSPLAYAPAEAATLADLLAQLDRDEPDLARALHAGLREGYLNILVNGRNARFLAGDRTPLAAGDVVAFLPPIGGG